MTCPTAYHIWLVCYIMQFYNEVLFDCHIEKPFVNGWGILIRRQKQLLISKSLLTFWHTPHWKPQLCIEGLHIYIYIHIDLYIHINMVIDPKQCSGLGQHKYRSWLMKAYNCALKHLWLFGSPSTHARTSSARRHPTAHVSVSQARVITRAQSSVWFPYDVLPDWRGPRVSYTISVRYRNVWAVRIHANWHSQLILASVLIDSARGRAQRWAGSLLKFCFYGETMVRKHPG